VCGLDPQCGVSCGTCVIEEVCSSQGSCTPILPEMGKVYGEVHEARPLNDTSIERGPAVVGAQVVTIDGVSTTSDDNGYYELQLRPGLVVIEAVAQGFYRGRAECDLKAGLAVECDIPLVRQEDAGQSQAARKSEPDVIEVGGYGCASVDGSHAPLALLILIPAWRRRRG